MQAVFFIRGLTLGCRRATNFLSRSLSVEAFFRPFSEGVLTRVFSRHLLGGVFAVVGCALSVVVGHDDVGVRCAMLVVGCAILKVESTTPVVCDKVLMGTAMSEGYTMTPVG